MGNFTAYDFLNAFIPGTLFAVVVSTFTAIDVRPEDPISGAAINFFLGIVIARISSLAVAPALRLVGAAQKSDYDRYIRAEREDPKLSRLSEVSNFYRTLMISPLLTIPFIFAFPISDPPFPLSILVPSLIFFAALFYLSWRKQESFIRKRVDFACKDSR